MEIIDDNGSSVMSLTQAVTTSAEQSTIPTEDEKPQMEHSKGNLESQKKQVRLVCVEVKRPNHPSRRGGSQPGGGIS